MKYKCRIWRKKAGKTGEKTIKDLGVDNYGGGGDGACFVFFAADCLGFAPFGTAYRCGIFVFHFVGGNFMKIVVLQPAGLFKRILCAFVKNKKDKK